MVPFSKPGLPTTCAPHALADTATAALVAYATLPTRSVVACRYLAHIPSGTVSTYGDEGFVGPIDAHRSRKGAHTPPSSTATSRCRRPLATPDPLSVPAAEVTLTVLSAATPSAYAIVPVVGAVPSATTENVEALDDRPAWFVAVTGRARRHRRVGCRPE